MSCSLFIPTRALIQPEGFLHRKKSAFQKLVKSHPFMKSYASAFIVQNKSQEDIIRTGQRADG